MVRANRDSAEVAAKTQHENTTAYIERACAGLDGASLRECIKYAVETAGEYQRAQRDLHAQTEMAEWSRWLLGVSIIATVVTAIGIYFVWRTLEEARHATLAAIQAAEAAEETISVTQGLGRRELRAYLHCEPTNRWEKTPEGIVDALDVRVDVVNTGQTPAYNVRMLGHTEYLLQGTSAQHSLPEHLDVLETGRTVCPPGAILRSMSARIARPTLDIVVRDRLSIVLFVRVIYDDVFDLSWATDACFLLHSV